MAGEVTNLDNADDQAAAGLPASRAPEPDAGAADDAAPPASIFEADDGDDIGADPGEVDDLDADGGDELAANDDAARTVPESPDDYAWPVVPGHNWSEAERESGAAVLEQLHAAGVSQAGVDAALGWYAQSVAAMRQRDVDAAASTREAMTEIWGDSYRPTVGRVKGMLEDRGNLPPGLGPMLMGARLADGRLLVNEPKFLAVLGSIARPGDGRPSGDGPPIGRKAEIEKVMSEDMNRYYREGLDLEYAKLLGREGPASRSTSSSQVRDDDDFARTPREREILRVMQTDIDQYYRLGLHRELAALRTARSQGRR